MTRLTDQCPQCKRLTWCGQVRCNGAPYVVAHMRERCGLPPLEPARPVISQPESVISQSKPVISRVISQDDDALSHSADYERLKRWREAHPETHRERHADYMRRYRARKEKPAAT